MSVVRTGIEMLIGQDADKVLMRFKEPILQVLFEPQNAFDVAEQLARIAHKVRFGEDAPDDGNYIAQQVRARVTEDMRDRMVQRISVMLNGMREQPMSNGTLAMHIVDRILADVL